MPVPKVSGLNCPNCGAGIELRSFTNATSVVCQNCLSVLDARDPNLRILQEAQSRQRIVPDIPLGTRGTFAAGTFEAIGFQERTVYEDGVAYSWNEYLLFNPYKGFRYLTVYRGHWNFVQTLNTLPQNASPNTVRVGDTTFKIFSNSMAQTTFVLGEFPWMVKVGEQVQVTDYIAPPKVLSAETTPEEIVWSMGDYMTGAEVWSAFRLATPVPLAYGVFENQPAPLADKVGSLWRTSLILSAAALLVAFLLYGTGSRKIVFHQSYAVGSPISASFDVPGHESNLELKTTNQTGEPIYVQYSLARDGANAIKFGRQVRTGGTGDVATIPSISSGRYVLSAEADAPTGLTIGQYEIELRRDVPSLGWFFGALALLLIPPILHSLRASSFERSRWAGSDL
jgi:hypothetical protein